MAAAIDSLKAANQRTVASVRATIAEHVNMKITISKLKQLIKEELDATLNETADSDIIWESLDDMKDEIKYTLLPYYKGESETNQWLKTLYGKLSQLQKKIKASGGGATTAPTNRRTTSDF